MSVFLQRQVEKIKQMLLALSGQVERSLVQSIEAVEKRDPNIAQEVIDRDVEIDIKEVDIEEEVLATLALHQPVANDLRFLVGVLKMNHDLERIGDLAVNIASQAVALSSQPPLMKSGFALKEMASRAQLMLKQSLDSLVSMDGELASRVRKMDDEVDQMHSAMYDKINAAIREDIDNVDGYIRLLVCGRQIERIADHATNIAKDVLYLVKGEIVRHARKRGLKLD